MCAMTMIDVSATQNKEHPHRAGARGHRRAGRRGVPPRRASLRLARDAPHPPGPQPSTLSHPPSTLNPQALTLSHQPSALNPQLSTLNPQFVQGRHESDGAAAAAAAGVQAQDDPFPPPPAPPPAAGRPPYGSSGNMGQEIFGGGRASGRPTSAAPLRAGMPMPVPPLVLAGMGAERRRPQVILSHTKCYSY